MNLKDLKKDNGEETLSNAVKITPVYTQCAIPFNPNKGSEDDNQVLTGSCMNNTGHYPTLADYFNDRYDNDYDHKHTSRHPLD